MSRVQCARLESQHSMDPRLFHTLLLSAPRAISPISEINLYPTCRYFITTLSIDLWHSITFTGRSCCRATFANNNLICLQIFVSVWIISFKSGYYRHLILWAQIMEFITLKTSFHNIKLLGIYVIIRNLRLYLSINNLCRFLFVDDQLSPIYLRHSMVK